MFIFLSENCPIAISHKESFKKCDQVVHLRRSSRHNGGGDNDPNDSLVVSFECVYYALYFFNVIRNCHSKNARVVTSPPYLLEAT